MIVPKLISPNVSHTHSGDDSRGRIVGPPETPHIQARTGNKGNNGYDSLVLIFLGATPVFGSELPRSFRFGRGDFALRARGRTDQTDVHFCKFLLLMCGDRPRGRPDQYLGSVLAVVVHPAVQFDGI